MASPARRRRASTSTGSQESVAELRGYLNNLSQRVNENDSNRNIQQKLQACHRIRQTLLETPSVNHAKDTFRRLEGFDKLIFTLREVSEHHESLHNTNEDSRALLDLVQIVFGVLSAALQDHKGNQKYFRCQTKGEGWQAIRGISQALLLPNHVKTRSNAAAIAERLFGSLLACALDDETLVGFFGRLKRQINEDLDSSQDTDPAPLIHTLLEKDFGELAFLHNPEALSTMLELWAMAATTPDAADNLAPSIALSIPIVISHVAGLSAHNMVALHNTGLLSTILNYMAHAVHHVSRISELRRLAIPLLNLGVTNLNDAHLLYRNANSSPLIADLLLLALQTSRTAPHLHFDLSLHGYASIELPNIGRAFPPVSSSAGYTLSIWLYVVKFDPNSHTTLFGAFDSSQTCFVLVYFEKDTRNLILQTSVTSSRPSVRFKSTVFQQQRWYHLCIVHRRSKPTVSSRASLFVNGEFVEQVKPHYPTLPPSSTTTTETIASLSPDRTSNPVQAFVGTPQDLASRLGRGVIFTQWRLASAHLFGDALSDDLIAVHHQLGPRYNGNYQDSLGSFQTYQASAALNLRNESLHPGKEEKSDILIAIQQKGSHLLPESKILLNISSSVVLDDNERSTNDEKQLVRCLSKPARKTLRIVTRGGRNALAINGAVPSISEALLHTFGFATITGDPAVTIPQPLDDAAWRIGGCAAVGLALLETAYSHNAIVRALKILFESVRDNWRNSEAMERENGFGVLSSLLASKLSFSPQRIVSDSKLSNHPSDNQLNHDDFPLEILTLTLEFVGYREDKPEDSVINNPLAYRVLLVDSDIWRSSAQSVQMLYYKQFTIFGVSSKYHRFNAKRLSRMRIVKKWLDALKGETFYPETLRYFVGAFKSVLTTHPSAESLRALALYITYAIHKPKQQSSTSQRPMKSLKSRSDNYSPVQTPLTTSPSSLSNENKMSSELTQLQVALKILEMYLDILCEGSDTTNIKKFARTVTNKWLLHLLADEEVTVVILAAKILCRLLVVNGSSYVKKFAEKTGGFVIMKYRLRRWWNIPTVWPIVFAVLFGKDIATVNLDRNFDLFGLLDTFSAGGNARVVYPEVLPVITAMLQNGLRAVTRDQEDADSPLIHTSDKDTLLPEKAQHRPTRLRGRSMSLNTELASIGGSSVPENSHFRTGTNRLRSQRLAESTSTLRTVSRFLADMHTNSQAFRDFAITSNYIQELFMVLFPIIVSSDIVSPETELHSRDSSLTFDGNEVIIRPLSQASMKGTPIIRTSSAEPADVRKPARTLTPRRMSSYVLVTSDIPEAGPPPSILQPPVVPGRKAMVAMNSSSSIVEELLEIIIAVFSEQMFSRKDFPGLGLFMKVPPGFQEHQAYFESFVLSNTLSHLDNTIKLNQKLLWEPRVLTNLARLATHIGEAIYEGWFIDGAGSLLDFLGSILEYLQRPDIMSMKSTRLCSQLISTMKEVLLRVVLLRLSELDDSDSVSPKQTISFLEKLVYWQTVLLSMEDTHEHFLSSLCFLLYNKLVVTDERVRMTAANFWRLLLVQKPEETTSILHYAATADRSDLTRGFEKLMELDNESFLSWVDDHREDLDSIFIVGLSEKWENFVKEENQKTEATAKARINKRRERLKLWRSEELTNDDILRRHEISSDHWRSNIYASENLKRQRALQDQQDSQAFNTLTWARMSRELRRPCGLFDDSKARKWQLDQTEGRNRMRMRLILDKDAHLNDYQPKRKQSQGPAQHRRSLGIRRKPSMRDAPASPHPSSIPSDIANTNSASQVKSATSPELSEDSEQDDDFEIIEDPRDQSEDYEDKNRKVMRSIHRGDQVEHVHNVSRIVGLEACEGLLILGKGHLYLMDNLFQRSDGEIVNVWQAPQEERDPYLQMISGREAGEHGTTAAKTDRETRSWRWDEVLSISKRRFLFRDVAVEVFFVDGRSYLLTSNNAHLRDELCQKLLVKAPNIADRTASLGYEETWRIDSIRNPEDQSQTLGSRFTNVFAQTMSNPATRKWTKGETSNFHYLMLINTMAGRTFNDLTQYPVFPWVLADYTSEELDLSDPRSFRDLTMPMGCQNPERQAEFRDRYQSFAEMGDHNLPPFHYGTHYSSAMIVTSYLIRLQPFVKSYLLLQGGSFDHPDRLFYSIEKAWSSASRENMTDVRELIPEFYYLPEFLLNSNGYDFGSRQGNGGSIDTVVLPPWAKGDPRIFIAKNREALESEHVSRNLHHWIDLVFGHKQRGEAALEATNVFHHLSYHGAKNLDTIDDPVERLATIGIIHNFGQTPHQVFQRPHLPREAAKHKVKMLDTAAENLTRLPFPLMENHDRISSLSYSWKHGRVLSSGPFRGNIGPAFDRYMEWGFVDGSVRFYSVESKKLIGLFEHVHQGQLSSTLIADSKTLITAGEDCTVSVWAIVSTSKTIDLQPKTCFFGHRTSVNTLAVSRSFSALLSASADGQVLLWDLNRLEFVRILTTGKPVECARINDVTGTIVLCRGSNVALYSLNGDPILEQNVCVEGDDLLTSCAFYEGNGNEYLERELIFTGHKRGVVNVWNKAIRNGKFVLEHVKRMNHLDQAGYNLGGAVTAVLPMAQKVFTGDEDGHVYEWDCIQRQ